MFVASISYKAPTRRSLPFWSTSGLMLRNSGMIVSGRVKIVQRQIGRFIKKGREHALISEIVDREAGPGRRPPPCPFPLVRDHERHQASLPVVDVYQLRLARQRTRKLRDGFGEKNEPLSVVRVIDSLFLVQFSAVEKVRLMNEINGQSRLPFLLEDLSLNAARAKRQIDVPVKPMDVREF